MFVAKLLNKKVLILAYQTQELVIGEKLVVFGDGVPSRRNYFHPAALATILGISVLSIRP